MDGRFYLAAALGDAKSSPSVPKGNRIAGFPKSVRILRSKDFRRVYDHGTRYAGPYFTAFYVRLPESAEGPKIGFTTPRGLGGSVVRNRIKRRVREAVRLRLDRLNPQWEIVFNPRRLAMDSPFIELTREVEKLFLRCNSL